MPKKNVTFSQQYFYTREFKLNKDHTVLEIRGITEVTNFHNRPSLKKCSAFIKVDIRAHDIKSLSKDLQEKLKKFNKTTYTKIEIPISNVPYNYENIDLFRGTGGTGTLSHLSF